MTKTKTIAAYCRCSTDSQNVALQRDDLQRYADRRDWNVVFYEDKGESGAKDHRPALDKMMSEVRKGAYDGVIVWKFDRFARSLTHLLSALNEFRELNVDFISVTEGVDTSTPSGKLLFQLLGAIAEFERSLIQERIKAGVARAKAEGVKFGRPRVGLDYKRAVELRKQGRSLRQIAKELGVSTSTVYRVTADVA